MNYPIHFDTISMELSIIYSILGFASQKSLEGCILSLKIVLTRKAAFHLGLQCLQKCPFTSISNENGLKYLCDF